MGVCLQRQLLLLMVTYWNPKALTPAEPHDPKAILTETKVLSPRAEKALLLRLEMQTWE